MDIKHGHPAMQGFLDVITFKASVVMRASPRRRTSSSLTCWSAASPHARGRLRCDAGHRWRPRSRATQPRDAAARRSRATQAGPPSSTAQQHRSAAPLSSTAQQQQQCAQQQRQGWTAEYTRAAAPRRQQLLSSSGSSNSSSSGICTDRTMLVRTLSMSIVLIM